MSANRSDVEFELGKGTCYLWTCFTLASYGVCLPFGYCFASKLMSSQEVHLDDKRLNYKSDCWCVRSDKMIPLERIQDVNVTQNLIARCCDVHNISIQTAAGSEQAEVTIIAPKNPKEVRDRIMATRDAFVYGAGSHAGDAGLGDRRQVGDTSPLLGREQVVAVNNTLLRMEALIEKGIEKISAANTK